MSIRTQESEQIHDTQERNDMEINLGHELGISGTRRANHRSVVYVNGIANVGTLRVEGNG